MSRRVALATVCCFRCQLPLSVSVSNVDV